jgi:hypothetical protein
MPSFQLNPVTSFILFILFILSKNSGFELTYGWTAALSWLATMRGR